MYDAFKIMMRKIQPLNHAPANINIKGRRALTLISFLWQAEKIFFRIKEKKKASYKLHEWRKNDLLFIRGNDILYLYALCQHHRFHSIRFLPRPFFFRAPVLPPYIHSFIAIDILFHPWLSLFTPDLFLGPLLYYYTWSLVWGPCSVSWKRRYLR